MSDEKTPLILRGYTDQQIAQNVRNMLMQKYKPEHDAITKKIFVAKKAGEPIEELERQQQEVQNRFEAEKNNLLRGEIMRYREEKKSSRDDSTDELLERIDELQGMVEEAQDAAEDAQNAAEEAQSKIDELELRIDDLELRLDGLSE